MASAVATAGLLKISPNSTLNEIKGNFSLAETCALHVQSHTLLQMFDISVGDHWRILKQTAIALAKVNSFGQGLRFI